MFRSPHRTLASLISKPKIGESLLFLARYIAYFIIYITDAYTFHQPKDDGEPIKNVLEDIQDAEKKNLTVKTIPGPAETAVGAIDVTDTAISQLNTFSGVYLQPLSTFGKIVTGIGKVCPFNRSRSNLY